ncbi:hypothetical protein VM1G_11627 [Cytospora mali]|uniref:Uncharacterized protein n=1 Tax=Cytospora mali TaxID=578113 RepID=A0A194VZ00_CYTMA|nr:hypothetical protein VM1G_11627 [Valsa mali]
MTEKQANREAAGGWLALDAGEEESQPRKSIYRGSVAIEGGAEWQPKVIQSSRCAAVSRS